MVCGEVMLLLFWGSGGPLEVKGCWPGELGTLRAALGLHAPSREALHGEAAGSRGCVCSARGQIDRHVTQCIWPS
jgi:hypothetical protein